MHVLYVIVLGIQPFVWLSCKGRDHLTKVILTILTIDVLNKYEKFKKKTYGYIIILID
jgi:hypothetical protein